MNFSNLNSDNDIFEAVQDNTFTNTQTTSWGDKFSFSKLLTTLSHYGMRYDDDVLKNMKAIPLDKTLIPDDQRYEGQNIFQAINDWQRQADPDKNNFFTKDITTKIFRLRQLSVQSELEDILDTMSDECIVYDADSTYICTPFVDPSVLSQLNEHSSEEIKNAVDKIFYKVYQLLDFKKGVAWYTFKKWLIEGVLAYEIIYDDLKFPKNILGIVAIDPSTLTKQVKDGTTYWIQNKGIIGKERVLIDSQIVYIKYEDDATTARQSYLERLIRPYNIYRIIEQAQIVWTVTQASFKTIFTIPVSGMNKAKGSQTLNSAMNRYKEDIQFNGESGELKVNGKMNLPFNKEYWLPENSNGKPSIETLTDGGPSIADNEQLRLFLSLLYKASKIPSNRFDNENQQSWFGTDPSQYMRDEIKFGRFVTRLRNMFSYVLIKPIQIQLTLSIPNIKADKRVLDAISLHFNSNNQFQEMMDIELKTKRQEFINSMKELTIINEDGEEEPYFSSRFLIEKYLRMPQSDMDLNEKYKKEEREAIKKFQNNGGMQQDNDNGFGGGGNDISSDMLGDIEPSNEPQGGAQQQGDQSTNGEITSDMLGDVQPETDETLTP